MHLFKLERFISAQENSYSSAFDEIKSGKKRSHWMWFIFPQLKGLGFSSMAEKYAINSLQEAEAYLKDPLLGKRLIEISLALMKLNDKSVHEIFGNPDEMKLRSSMTLFSLTENRDQVFRAVLNKYFEGLPDPKTLVILNITS
ncbi:DUF1810 domain-containing protein [soil metagenome]